MNDEKFKLYTYRKSTPSETGEAGHDRGKEYNHPDDAMQKVMGLVKDKDVNEIRLTDYSGDDLLFHWTQKAGLSHPPKKY